MGPNARASCEDGARFLENMKISDSHAASLSIQATADLEDDEDVALALLHFRFVLGSTFPARY